MDLGSERGTPIHSSEPARDNNLVEAEREKDGALGGSGGQPDASPSGPNDNYDLPEPKV